MKIIIHAPTVRARMVGDLDCFIIALFLLFMSILFDSWFSSEKLMRLFWDDWFIFGPIMLILAIFALCGLAVLFSRMEVSQEGIKYRYLRSYIIPWSSVVEYRYLGVVPKLGFTPRIMIKTESGKVHLIPVASAKLLGFFQGLQTYNGA